MDAAVVGLGVSPIEIIELIALGVVVAALGTLIGAGGGLIFVPVFLYMFPDWSPAMVVGTSLLAVMCNAISGSWAYVRQKKVLYSAAIIFSIATFPGSYIGAQASGSFNEMTFRFWFGLFLLCMSVLIGYKNWKKGERKEEKLTREELTYNKPLGIGISAIVGFISSIFGIGGGLIHVPALIYLMGFPTHMATATSHFILAVSTMVGVASHFIFGHIQFAVGIPCSIGAIFGAQLGAQISKRMKATSILMVLSIGVGALALRLIYTSHMFF